MDNFQGITAVITGAGSGIGRAFAIELAKRGANLALSDISQSGLDETKQQLPRNVLTSTTVVDVISSDQMNQWAESIRQQHGQINLLINNAGIAAGGEFINHGLTDIEAIVNINFRAVAIGSRLFLPDLIASGNGHIVNISSMVAYMGLPGNAMYAATKFAIRGFSEALAAELNGSNVGLTVAFPGAIKTNIMRSAKFTSDEDKQKLVQLMDRFAMNPERAVNKILSAVLAGRRTITMGAESRLLWLATRIAPRITWRLVAAAYYRTRNNSPYRPDSG